MRPYGRITRVAATACLLAAVASSAGACAIPVFRYALERWHPDDYLVAIVHRGPLNESDQSLVDRLQAARGDSARPANLQVATLDVAELPAAAVATEPAAEAAETSAIEGAEPERPDGSREALLKLLTRDEPGPPFKDLESPRMIVLLPVPGAAPWRVWSGPLAEVNVQRLIDSPARQTIVDRILAGDSAVWVLLASGDKAKDDQAEATLRAELARVEKILTLPARELLEAEQEFRPDTPVQLRIGFSLVRIEKDDAEETLFRAMLLASEADLVEFQDPIAMPIYGRGRTCFALVGKGIHADTIEENCRFLCEGCSCMIKQQNPGIDMLMAVDWDARVEGTAMPDLVLPELTGIGALAVNDRTASEPAADPAPTDPSPADTQAAPAPTATPLPAPAAPPAEQQVAPPGDSADPLAAPPTAAEVAVPPSSHRFARRLLGWTLAGVGVATLFVLGITVWMRTHSN